MFQIIVIIINYTLIVLLDPNFTKYFQLTMNIYFLLNNCKLLLFCTRQQKNTNKQNVLQILIVKLLLMYLFRFGFDF